MKAVIFDFDGTLANTLPLCFAAFRDVFQQFDGITYTDEEIVAMFGPPEEEMLTIHLRSNEADAAIERYFELYEARHHEFVQPNAAITQLLDTLKSRGYQLGIFTGKGRRALDISLTKLQMTDYFDAVITGDDVKHHKPHPEGLQHVLALLDTKAEDAIYIGDSNSDMAAGRDAGVTTYGAHWLDTFQASEFTTQPARILTSVDDFYTYILK